MSNLTDENEKGPNQTDSSEPYGRIQSEQEKREISGTIRTGDKSTNQPTGRVVTNIQALNTIEERIEASTAEGGLKILPTNFGKPEGDWKIIESTGNLFEMLYLDYRQHLHITPDMTRKNFDIINEYWKTQNENWGSSNARAKEELEKKFTKKNLEECLKRITYAYQQLDTAQNIDEYYKGFRREQMLKGEKILDSYFDLIAEDNKVEPNEINGLFKRGEAIKLSIEETAQIIQKAIDARNLKPYNAPAGELLSEQLLSVSWMTDELIIKMKAAEEALDKIQQNAKIQILPGKYASTINEIGTILFNDPSEAKEIIKDNLLKPAIAQKDIVLAKEVGSISSNSKDINASFFQIVYKLNNTLPFLFIDEQRPKNIQELTGLIFENEQSLKAGKDYLKKGYIEIWLKETDKQAHAKLISIRDAAENLDQAFLAMLYAFNPSLPYRFAGNIFLKNRTELANEINKNSNTWNAGKAELYNGFINTWLQNTGDFESVSKWNKIKPNVESEDAGLEAFLHILDDKLENPVIKTSVSRIDYPAIQSGKKIETEIQITLANRGYTSANLAFSKELPGVSLSVKKIFFNAAANDTSGVVTISIDSLQLLKGVEYNTSIVINTSVGQVVEIPVTFKIIFPKNAFIFQIVKYAIIFAAFFVLIRFIISSTYEGWLSDKFNFFLSFDQAWIFHSNFSIFAWGFFAFIACSVTGIYFLIKYLRKK